MRNTWIILTKELRVYFLSPIAHLIISFFIFFSGLIFTLMLYQTRTADLRGLFYSDVIVILLIAPLITMRLFAEEKKTGTIELLMTNPLSDWEVVLGKYLSVFVFYLCLVASTLIFFLILIYYSTPDPGSTLSGYLGLILIGGAFIAVGTFTSSLCKNQIIAAITSFSLLLVLWFIDEGSGILLHSGYSEIFEYMSTFSHFNNMIMGKIDTSDVIFFLSFIFFFLFLTTRIVESRKWR